MFKSLNNIASCYFTDLFQSNINIHQYRTHHTIKQSSAGACLHIHHCICLAPVIHGRNRPVSCCLIIMEEEEEEEEEQQQQQYQQ